MNQITVSGSVAFALTVLSGCVMTGSREPIAQPLLIKLSQDRGLGQDPILRLAITNVTDKPVAYLFETDYPWGDVVVQCGSRTLFLRHRDMWQRLGGNGFWVPDAAVLEPRRGVVQVFALTGEFITKEEFLTEEIDVSQTQSGKPANLKWLDECATAFVFCRIGAEKWTSNVVSVKLFGKGP